MVIAPYAGYLFHLGIYLEKMNHQLLDTQLLHMFFQYLLFPQFDSLVPELNARQR